jgi:hypothetical protein
VWIGFSLTERTEFTEFFGAQFETTERLRHTEVTEASPPAPLRMERGVVCEVTPFGLLMIGDGPLNIWRTCRGISVITPLSIRRGVGGEAAKVLALNRKHRALQLTLAVNSVISVACLQAFVSSKR